MNNTDKQKVTCIFHRTDLDGYFSAGAVALRYPNAEFIGWTYGDSLPEVTNQDLVIITDISFKPQEMLEMSKQNNQLVWIDHHETSINAMADFLESKKSSLEEFKDFFIIVPKIYRQKDNTFCVTEKKGACELTWEYLFPEEKTPDIITIAGAYDSFRHYNTKEEETVNFLQWGMRNAIRGHVDARNAILQYKRHPEETRFSYYHDGKLLYKSQQKKVFSAFNNGFPIKLADKDTVYTFLIANQREANPKAFRYDYENEGYNGAGTIHMDYNWEMKELIYTITIYSETVDCGKIASEYGGGGHQGAAGFKIRHKEFKILDSSLFVDCA